MYDFARLSEAPAGRSSGAGREWVMTHRSYDSRAPQPRIRRLLAAVACACCVWSATACHRDSTATAAPPSQADIATALRAIDASLARGDSGAALTVARRLAERVPQDPDVRATLGRCLLAAASDRSDDVHGALSLRREALRAYSDAARLAPTESEAPHSCGVIAGMLPGEDAEAVGWFREASRRRPTDPRHPLFEGLALSRQGLLDPAASALERACTLAPNDATTLASLAEVCARRGDATRAISLAAAARAAAPDDPNMRLVEARVVRLAGRAERARALLLALDTPTLASEPFARELAQCHFALGEWLDRARALERLAASQPQLTDAAIDTAMAYAEAGQRDEARYWLDRAASHGAPPHAVDAARQQIMSASDRHRLESSPP